MALRIVREKCRLLQKKWALAGPLAQLEAAELRKALSALVGRHLLLREADGSYSAHPAIRDHFARLATAPEQEAWHDIIREQLISLAHRPGRNPPEDRAALDMIEEAIHHALQAGRRDEALWLFNDVLGGMRHLAWKLGEINRGLRILRGFDPCPDTWALSWFLRALGEYEEAYAHNDMPYFRADIRLLQGRLPEVAAEGDSTRTAIAAFLMGQSKTLPPQPLSCPIPRDQLLLYLGRLSQIGQSVLFEKLYHEIGWESDRARCQVLLAEVARRQGVDWFIAYQQLKTASTWILHSGSVEHLCLLHLVGGRFQRSNGLLAPAQKTVTEGLHVARQGGLGLYLVELLCEQAEIFLAGQDAPAAHQAADEALRLAEAPECRFLWGAAEAGYLPWRALLAMQCKSEARAILMRTLNSLCPLGYPRVEHIKQLLANEPG